MRYLTSLATGLCLLTMSSLPSLTSACMPERRQDSSTPDGFFTMGADGPAAPQTNGFFINHLALNVHNLTRSMEFYSNVLGMRHIFTTQMSPTLSITYMGHAQGGRNHSGFQTAEELLREKNNAAGMLELQYYAPNTEHPENIPAMSVKQNTFSHIGLIVPDLAAAETWMREAGVKITKPIGKDGNVPEIRNAWGIATATKEEEADILVGQEMLGFPKLLVVEDPDGNVIEVQQQVPPPGVA